MSGGDFFANEQSVSIEKDTTVHIEMQASGGDTAMLREGIALEAGDVIDATFMSCQALVKFLGEQMDDAKAQDILFSLHMKATMMKVSDPIIFGHCVRVYFKDVFAKYKDSKPTAAIEAANFNRTLNPG